MSRLAAATGAWALSLALGVSAAPAADLALVIGNQDYSRAPDALSARADARAVAEALTAGGYEVIQGTDVSRAVMRRLLADFAGRVAQAERVVVFYSGHALRSGGLSYLAPVDQGNGSLVEVMLDGVPLDLVLRLAGEASGRAVVFVDGAQLDGFTPRSFAEPGLAHIEPPGGVLVVSAAAPGRAIPRRSTAMSDFGRFVVSEFLAPGASIGQGVRGLGAPGWVGGDTDSALVLVPAGRRPLAGTGTGTGTGGLTPTQAEARLGLTSAERREIQESLTLLGHDTRGVDGVFGAGTRAAIRGWQRANGQPETGFLTGEQVALIRQQARQGATPPAVVPLVVVTPAPGATPAEVETRLGLSAAERSEVQENLTRLGYDTRGTDGIFGYGTRTAIRNWQRANGLEDTGYLSADQIALLDQQAAGLAGAPSGRPPADPAAAEAALNLTRTDRLSVEQRLAFLGFPPGPQDGFFDADTRWAIEGYQRSRGHAPTGYLDQPTVAGIVQETQGARTGIVTGATVLMDILRGLGGQ
jgi:peptidoglycan hydrolase-like protein with peptidoglycan-binding domain